MTNPVRLRLTTYNARLVDARKAKGLTQMDLSLLTGISTSLIGHIETLRLIPSRHAIDEICSALDLSEDYLFPSSLLDALREGVFDHRVVELEEKQIIRLTETRRAGLLPQGITERDALDEVESALDNDLLKQRLPDILKTLHPREQEIIELRFGLKDDTPRTLEEVSFHFINKKTGTHLTRDRIRQIEAKALRKLRHPSRSRQLKHYL